VDCVHVLAARPCDVGLVTSRQGGMFDFGPGVDQVHHRPVNAPDPPPLAGPSPLLMLNRSATAGARKGTFTNLHAARLFRPLQNGVDDVAQRTADTPRGLGAFRGREGRRGCPLPQTQGSSGSFTVSRLRFMVRVQEKLQFLSFFLEFGF